MYYNCRVDEKTNQDVVDKGPAKQIDPSCCYDKFQVTHARRLAPLVMLNLIQHPRLDPESSSG